METIDFTRSNPLSFHTEKVASFEGQGSLYKIASDSTPDIRVFKFARSVPVFGQTQRPVTISWSGSFTPQSVIHWLEAAQRSLPLLTQLWTIEIWPGEDTGDNSMEGARGEPLVFRIRRSPQFVRGLLTELEAAAAAWSQATVTLRPDGGDSSAYVWGALSAHPRIDTQDPFNSFPAIRRDAEVGIRLDISELLEVNGERLVADLLAATDSIDISARDLGGLIRSVRSALRTG